MRPEELRREVNRLYWETDGPVTRMAGELGVSRGTFYNHVEPLSAGAGCGACGEPLYFGTRAERDGGDAHCAACGAEERVGPPAEASAGTQEAAAAAGAPSSAPTSRLASRLSWLTSEEDEDDTRTRLLMIAVGAAVLGLGILYYSRRRS